MYINVQSSTATAVGTVVAQLTRLGRQILADNSANFKISQYQFSDDEINYAQFDGSTVDAPNSQVLATPILEPNTFGKSPSQRYSLFTKPGNTLQIARMDTDIGMPFVDGTQDERPERSRALLILNSDVYNANNPFKFTVRTFYGYDSAYLISDNSSFLAAGGPGVGGGGSESNNIRDRVVIPFIQKPDTFPCSDPYETLQHQSQAEIQIHVSISPDDYILANFAFNQLSAYIANFDLAKDLNLKLRSTYTEAELVQAWNQYIINRIQAGQAQALRASQAVGSVRDGSDFTSLQYVDQYKETGIASVDITVRGVDTGLLFTVGCLVYSGTILGKILQSALEG